MPAKTATVYVCDRCQAETPESAFQALGWQSVIIPTIEQVPAGSQLLCPSCSTEAKAFMDALKP